MVGKRILLTEGEDDKHVVWHICGNRDVIRFDETEPYKGVDELLNSFVARVKTYAGEGDTVAIVLDANGNINARWSALTGRLAPAGYRDLPLTPDPSGTVIPAPSGTLLPRVGIWLMPDNVNPGILEDFLNSMVMPPDSPLFRHVQESVDKIPEGPRVFLPKDKPKAVIHTWLAWQVEPGLPFGTAIKAHFLDHSVPQVDLFAAWLRKLLV